MSVRAKLIGGVVLMGLSAGLGAQAPDPQVREVKAPWGVVLERVAFYIKDGEAIQHGFDEMFLDDGGIQIRTRYIDGEPDGLSQSFYEGLGTMQTETMFVEGNEHGTSRTWDPDGELLFTGTWRNGEEWEGWFDRESSSMSGIYHQRGESWKITQWKEGKKIRGSMREVEVSWRDWKPGSSPDLELFCRWRWSQFMKPEGYPYLDRMPPYRDVPFLISYCTKKEPRYQVAWDQLMALTRVSFGDPWLQSDDERKAATAKWQEWWQDVGRHRPQQRNARGVRDVAAWKIAQGDRGLPIPELAVVIPETYQLTAHFSSGDYLGVTTETLTIERSRDGAELVRRFSTRQDGPVTEERWLPFSPEEADRLVRALGYLVDQPWLLNDEKDIERRYWEAEKLDAKSETMGNYGDESQEGRESYGRPYYPNAGYELRDEDGKLWWNAEADHWNGGNPERFNHSQQAAPGVVFPFLAKSYPESERRENGKGRGWAAK